VTLLNLENDAAGIVAGAVVGVLCEGATLGIGSFGCGIIGGIAGVGVAEGLNSLDEALTTG
jgi:hypothetical protein